MFCGSWKPLPFSGEFPLQLNFETFVSFYSHSVFVCLVQGFWALGDLSVLTDSHEKPDMLAEFVTAQKDKLGNMCSKAKNELFSHCEENVCKCNHFGALNLIISLVQSAYFLLLYILNNVCFIFSSQCQKCQGCMRK